MQSMITWIHLAQLDMCIRIVLQELARTCNRYGIPPESS